MEVRKKRTINYKFSDKHTAYIRNCRDNTYNIAEGAIRAGKTVDHIYAFFTFLRNTKDKIHLASGSTLANAKLNIGDSNGYGLEHLFRGQCRWGKYKDNEALIIKGPYTNNKQRIVIFAGASKADSFKKIRGNSYGGWIATEINLHHDNFIKEAINRTAAADQRRFFWDLNPDHPKHFIYLDYIDNYRKKAENGEDIGGCNYQHFTINDNITIPDERKKQIAAGYDKNSIWYQRDILGKRVVAEGLIYRQFADSISSGSDKYIIKDVPGNVTEIYIGVDFGGSGSYHAFVAIGITYGFHDLICLASERHKPESPTELDAQFVEFLRTVMDIKGNINGVYCDSAEQVLIRGLQNAAIKAGFGNVKINNALKESITERITFTNRMIAQDRIRIIKEKCETLIDALCSATWDPKNLTSNERLDDGTNDIDTLDAFEYTFERFMSLFIRRR